MGVPSDKLIRYNINLIYSIHSVRKLHKSCKNNVNNINSLGYSCHKWLFHGCWIMVERETEVTVLSKKLRLGKQY